jgi:hypothetical protein
LLLIGFAGFLEALDYPVRLLLVYLVGLDGPE